MVARGTANAASIEEVSVTIEEMAKGTTRLAADSQVVGERIAASTQSLVVVGRSLGEVAIAARELEGTVNETASTTEELSRSVRVVADHAKQI